MIELLIVITIVGILSAIILNSISSSRAKAYDSKIKQQLGSFRTAAEMYFTNQGRYSETIGVPVSNCDAGGAAGIFDDFDAVNGRPGLYIASGSLPSFSQVFCGATDSAYAVKATLYHTNEYWCVDSKGASKMIPGMPASGTVCPP